MPRLLFGVYSVVFAGCREPFRRSHCPRGVRCDSPRLRSSFRLTCGEQADTLKEVVMGIFAHGFPFRFSLQQR